MRPGPHKYSCLPLPTLAMSDQHNKKQCVSMCSHEQLGGLGGKGGGGGGGGGVKREGESCASPNLLPCLERVEFFKYKSQKSMWTLG